MQWVAAAGGAVLIVLGLTTGYSELVWLGLVGLVAGLALLVSQSRATSADDPDTWDRVFDGTQQVTWTGGPNHRDRAVREANARGYRCVSTGRQMLFERDA
jgi:hypothetical protein